MPCMCGDIRCWSCGPAQGNCRCDICGKWDDEGGCTNPQACIEKAAEEDAKLAAEEAEMQRLADDYWKDEARRLGEKLCPHGSKSSRCNACLVDDFQRLRL